MIKSSAVAVTQFSKLRKLFVYNTIEKKIILKDKIIFQTFCF